jgi:hypothetical protein
MVDATDPYAVALDFVVPLVFAPNTGCSVDITLHVRELGDATTPQTIAQQYTTNGECLCEPGLISGTTISTQISLTCPPCSTNFCAPEICNPTTVQCDPQTPPDCSNPDKDLCTPGFCDPAAKDGNGACVNGPRTVCGNEGSFCTPGHCEAKSGSCVLDPPPDCDDNNPCTSDRCTETTGCIATPINCDDGNACNGVETCDTTIGCIAGTPLNCDDGNACTNDSCSSAEGCVFASTTAPPETIHLVVAADKVTFSWAAALFATQYDVLRGSTKAFPVGPGGDDEICFGGVTDTTLTDATVPANGSGYWYLVRGENACGVGTFGTLGDGSPRITTTCP